MLYNIVYYNTGGRNGQERNRENEKKSEKKLVVKDNMEEKVGILRVHPNLTADQILVYKGYKGLIVEGTGLGHAPVGVPNELSKGNEKNFKAIKELIADGTTVVMTSQTIFGRVQMHVYSSGRDLMEIGV
ncbi:MAG: hypothetical protein ACE5FF_16685, partial [Saprospiraceae bacterium]